MVVLLMAVGLKYHYSHARSNDLGWILGPTAGVVEYISGIAFEKEGGAGFVNRANRIIIAPSCAGVNFLIIAFCMAAFSGLHRLNSFGLKIFWLGNSAAWTYVLTIAVNAFRIVTSIHMYNADIYYHGLTPERLHRIEGIFIYLCQYQDSIGSGHAPVVPLFWYLMISLGIPLLNRSYHKNGRQFVEHSLVILCVCMVVFLVVFLIQSCWGWIFRRIQVYRPRKPNPASHGRLENNCQSTKI
ncbi:MAG: exosortase K [Deltaproteobacteria bacterium]|nr:exosortase K [Deltaproteobacteria bacterium]